MSEIIPIFEDSGQRSTGALRGGQEARVMMMLGSFAFSIDTTAYHQLTREASWRWSEQERIGKQDLLQYTGKPGRTVRLEGQSHAFFRKGVEGVNDLFDLAETGETSAACQRRRRCAGLVGGDRLFRHDE